MSNLLHEAAVHYQQAADMGEPPTAAGLGQRYGRSDRWGRRAIAVAKEAATSVVRAATDIGQQDDESDRADADDNGADAEAVHADNPDVRVARPRGRWVAWSAVALGVLLSTSGNVLSAWPRGEIAAASAAAWPVLLFVSLEVLTRISWPRTAGYLAARYIGVSAVATVSAVVSYVHLHGVLLAMGEPMSAAIGGPLAIDGMLLLGSAAMLATSQREQP